MLGLLSCKFTKFKSSIKHACHAQHGALSLLKKDNEIVGHYAMKVETLLKQGL